MYQEIHGARFDNEGRVGKAKAGDIAGEYVYIFPEIEGRWGYYTSGGGDDILPDAEYLEWQLEQHKVEWLSGDEETRIEAELFGMRPRTSSEYDNPQGPLNRLLGRLRRRHND